MKVIWMQPKASYSGPFVEFLEMMTWANLVQQPHPPILMGGAFPFGAKRAIEYCDGWFAHAARPAYGTVLDMFPQFRQTAAEAGRDADSIPIILAIISVKRLALRSTAPIWALADLSKAYLSKVGVTRICAMLTCDGWSSAYMMAATMSSAPSVPSSWS